MKKTIAKINETKSSLFEKKNKLINLQQDSSRKKERELKSAKLEIKTKLQLTLQKYKGS